MDAAIVSTATAVSVGLASLYWQLLVAPERVILIFGDPPDEWEQERESSTLAAFRWALGMTVFTTSFCTGAAVAYLAVIG